MEKEMDMEKKKLYLLLIKIFKNLLSISMRTMEIHMKVNTKRNGKGKEFNWNGKLIFEGEYLN